MKYSLCLFLIIALNLKIQGQNDPDSYLLKGDKVPQVLLVGTFHFGYPNLDSHKTKDEYKLDILSDQRQEELRELLDYIKRFNPTKIMIEAGRNTGYLMNRMRRWQKGEEQLRRSESDQVGLRLVTELGLDTIYGIDAVPLMREMFQSKDSSCFKSYFSDILTSRDSKPNPFDDRYWEWYDVDDQITYEMNLLEYFKLQNSEKNIKRMHGHYILNDHYDDYNSVDGWLLLNWYSRNLRILKNVHRIETNPEDRIMILFGSGHLAILQEQIEASPEYQLIKFGDLERY